MIEPYGNECLNEAHEAVNALKAARRACDTDCRIGWYSLDAVFDRAILAAEKLADLLEHADFGG